MKVKIDQADRVMSQYIRLRDGRCMRCGSAVELNDKGLPVTHQNSHFFGRVKNPLVSTLRTATRFVWHVMCAGAERIERIIGLSKITSPKYIAEEKHHSELDEDI